MANIISNTLEIIGNDEQVKNVKEFLMGEPYEDGSARYVDFNKIIKTPEESVLICDSTNSLVEFNWYDWRCENWGTKWNAFDQYLVSDNIVCFDTAWCGVPELIRQLSMKFLDIKFEYDWMDYTDNVFYTFINGELMNYIERDVLYETIGHPELGLRTQSQIISEDKRNDEH